MIYFVRSATIVSGAGRHEAMEFTRDVTRYINETYPEVNVELLTSMTGRLNRVVWVTKFNSMAAAEEFTHKLHADEKYRALQHEAAKTEEKRPFWVDFVTDTYWNIAEL